MAPGGEVGLRAAMPGEAAALTALCLRSKAHWGYDAAFMEACRGELTLHEDELDGPLRVAECAGALAGMVQLAQAEGDWHVEKLFVDPAFMGRGAGAALMRWAIGAARDAGARRLVIEADPGAAGFYRRFGAREAGQVPSGSIPGRMLPRLVLDLSPEPDPR